MQKKPDLKPNDLRIIVNDWEDPDRFIGEMKCYSADGKLLWQCEALAKGQDAAGRQNVRHGDTVGGLYLLGDITETRPDESTSIWYAYGKYFVDMVEQEGQEAKYGRAGLGIHGAGTAAPDPLAPKQVLVPTLGCIRLHNESMEKLLIPSIRKARAKGGRVWLTVNQID